MPRSEAVHYWDELYVISNLVDGTDLATANASFDRGPGTVAPIGLGGHFPPEVFHTPPVADATRWATSAAASAKGNPKTVCDSFTRRAKPTAVGTDCCGWAAAVLMRSSR